MRLTILFALLGLPICGATLLAGEANPPDRCNVVWDSPSKDSSGSMPVGNQTQAPTAASKSSARREARCFDSDPATALIRCEAMPGARPIYQSANDGQEIERNTRRFAASHGSSSKLGGKWSQVYPFDSAVKNGNRRQTCTIKTLSQQIRMAYKSKCIVNEIE